MRTIAISVVLLLTSVGARAQPYYARGEFNSWGLDDPLTLQGGVHYTGIVSGLIPGNGYEYKIALADWSDSSPGSNGRVVADTSGQASFHFWDNDTWIDGWQPSAKQRVGYDDPGMFNWEVIGSFDAWTVGNVMTDMGGGLWSVDLVFGQGTYDWKFRKEGDWDVSIGDDFGNAAANNNLEVDNNGDIWRFELDLPNGRWRTHFVPEPASLGFLIMGAAALLRRKRVG